MASRARAPSNPRSVKRPQRTWGDCALKIDPAFEHELRHVMFDRDALCPSCRYNLSGIENDRCPECGVRLAEYLKLADTTPRRLGACLREARRRRILAWLVAPLIGAALALCVMIAALNWL